MQSQYQKPDNNIGGCMKAVWVGLTVILAVTPSAAYAAPGLDNVVYGATVEAGKSELEMRYGRLTGGSADGEDSLVFEAARGFSSRFYGAVRASFERVPGNSRRLEALALEGVVTLGRIRSLDLDTAVYIEAEHGLHGHDNLETKLLLERRKGRFDTRLNLIAKKPLKSGTPLGFGYAASADYRVAGDMSVGAEAFGELGTSSRFTTHGAHYAGPSVKLGIDHFGPGELDLRAGYLIALDRARDEVKGQLRFGMEFEF